MNIQLERIHNFLHRLERILHEYPDTTGLWSDEAKDFRIGTGRMREEYDLYLREWKDNLDAEFGEVEDD